MAAVLDHFTSRYGLQKIALAGYSMGGNLVLKLAGEYGATPPPALRAVVGVSPALDLAASAEALHLPSNRLYEWKFVRALLKRFRRKTMLFPRVYDSRKADLVHSLKDFDQHITALYAGFRSADDYYFRAAAARVLQDIHVPTLILHALDDPFVRLLPESREKIAGNPHVQLLESEHGGHCAFLATPDAAAGDDGYWAESTLLAFIAANA